MGTRARATIPIEPFRFFSAASEKKSLTPDIAHLSSLFGVHKDFPKKGDGCNSAVSLVASVLQLLAPISLSANYNHMHRPHDFATGIVFRDMFPILRDPIASQIMFTALTHHIQVWCPIETKGIQQFFFFSLHSHYIIPGPMFAQSKYGKVDVIVGLDSRGLPL